MTDNTSPTTDTETTTAPFGIDVASLNQEMVLDFITNDGASMASQLLGALVIFFLGRMAVRMLVKALRKAFTRAEMDITLSDFLCNVLGGIGLAFVVVAALSQLGIETTSLAAIIGAAGLAIGLSMQDSLSNLAAGVMMITFRPFTAGDYVEAGGVSGSAQSIGIFTTTMITPDNKTIIIPNSSIISGAIINYSKQPTRRIDMVFGIGYGDDLKKAKQVMIDVLEADSRILKNPAPVVAVSELADSSVNFVVRPWVKSADYWDVYFEIHEQMKLRLDAEGISIPFPQREVTIMGGSDAKAASEAA